VPDCIFCEIVRDERPAHTVVDTDDVVAFLDARPVFFGHTLVVPTQHHVTLPDLPTALLAPLFTQVQRVATAMVAGLGADGSFVAVNNVVSQSVAHLHVHVVPRRRKDGLRGFFWPRHTYESDTDMADYAARLRAALPTF
jgi:histidine triad (HIT) family protein